MEIIIGSVCMAFVAALLIVRSAINSTVKDFIQHDERKSKLAADERAELTKLIKAENLTDFEMNRRVEVQPPRKLTPEQIKVQQAYAEVGTVYDDDLRGQIQYS